MIYRDEPSLTLNTKFYLLNKLDNPCRECPDDSHLYDKDNEKFRPHEWFKIGFRNKSYRGYAAADFDERKRRVYVRPTPWFDAHIHNLHKQGKLGASVTNYIDGVCQVTFFVIETTVAIQMDSVTGAVPAGHPMFGHQPDLLVPAGHTQRLLTGQMNPGNYGSSRLT